MDRFTVYKTDKGRYAVRPIDWAGIWDKDWNIKENGINHTAIFAEKEDAEFFARTKNAEEQGKLLILPCKPGDTVWILYQTIVDKLIGEYSILKGFIQELAIENSNNLRIKVDTPYGVMCFDKYDMGKTVFLTEQEAKEALKGIQHEKA